jgi:hypothetical protein
VATRLATGTATRWREPASALPLRWGTYEGRYLAGLLYIMAGLVILVGSNTYTVPFLLVGTVAHVAGWFILPAAGARRLWVAWPSLICVWLMLTGPQILFAMALPLLGWLVVRQRPARSYVVLVLPAVTGVLLANTFHSNHDEPLAFAIETVVVVGSAWLARALATTKRVRVVAPLPSPDAARS